MAENPPLQLERSVTPQNNTSPETLPCRKRLRHDAYTIGWVCALPKEQTAARAMLDEEHEPLPTPRNDHNAYTLGLICGHNVVIACLPNMGINPAATVATSMINTFQSIRFGLMVGIGSGIPSKVNLGDVVVSQPVADYHGVVQWDLGKLERGGQFVHTGSLNRPPNLLLHASNQLKSNYEMYGSKINEYLDDVERKFPRLAPRYTRREENEQLSDNAGEARTQRKFPRLAPRYTRREENEQLSDNAGEARTQRKFRVHYGLIASGNKVVKDAQSRDSLDKAFGGHVLCVEIEAAGLMNDFPCIVIRGICDYADSEREKSWQEYAAAMAAAYAKELLGCVQPSVVGDEDSAKAILENVQQEIDCVQQITATTKAVMKLNEDNPDPLTSMYNLASMYLKQGRWNEAEKLFVQVTEARKTKLGADHPDTLTSMSDLASTYRNQGRLEEAEQLYMQVRKTRRQILGSGHLNVLDVSSEPAEYDRHVEFGDTDSSSDNDSVFSVPASIPSTSSFDSGRGEMNLLLIHQFSNLLSEDGDLLSLLLIGVSREPIGFERMRNNFRRLLKHFANDLKADILSASHRDLMRFVSSYSVMITRKLFAMVFIDEQPKLNPDEDLAHKRKVEYYLQSLQDTFPQTSEVIDGLNPDEDSDQGSVAEGANEDEPYEGSLQNLDQMKHFILQSAAYQILRRRLEDFVQPSLNSHFRDLVTRWSNPEHKNHGDAARYKLRNLVTDLQHVSPLEIRFERDEINSRFLMVVSYYQHLIERWTGESWDWWPLPRYPRPLAESETRLRWKCVCGEERWAEVPNTLVKRLQSIIRRLPVDSLVTQLTPPPPEAHTSNPNPCNVPNISVTSNQTSYQGHRVKQPDGSPSNPSLRLRPSGHNVNSADMSITRQHVLFLAKQGGDYRLAQICISNMTCHSFFSTMKKEYFRLRGVLRSWFSVWRYSHCDFYKFEKFDDHEFTLRIKDSFPDHANTDYEYQPRPMDNIPPISEHEFMKRFYACHNPRPLLHLHHECRKLGAHSSDILQFLPKKRTELEEAGNKREDFWGIYAREKISLRWIIFYNFLCVSPLLAFFLAWILPRELGTDLQNPSIPLSMMIAMLSLFWSVYLSSLQFEGPL
ncbi:hypothetical protein N7508_006486 [Penicillium antarcticum]|uniref:uncharacterized protein n=1 Tax=Penicillium antarcticum TaxID=416450 RepID=UPI0023865A8C|nr:uncharacterized protein N7508_006486 [Penicillium antarcticum]KAJ5301623.1 hypothetical protein N7508_006486 [Penicillium antarcticum]